MEKEKVIILTHRDIYNDGGEKTLMEHKRKWLYQYGYEVQYISFIQKKSTAPTIYPFYIFMVPLAFYSHFFGTPN